MIRAVADANVPYLEEALAGVAALERVPARALTAETVRDAELLFVRSTVRVGPALLDGSRVRFVATATIGVDHVDLAYLASRGIAFAAAPGSNSTSVAEWFVAALLTLAERRRLDPAALTIGVVGVGNVGAKVARNAAALGARVLVCDPPLARATGDARFRPLDALLERSDVLTLHVPLERDGADPTFHLLDAAALSRLRRGAVLVNAARGPIVDGAALARALDDGHLGAAILDCWEGEPAIDPELVRRVALASPHVAGHSLDGKARGTAMVVDAACRFLGVASSWTPARSLPPTPVPTLRLRGDAPDAALVLEALRALYRIEEDDAFVRGLADLPADERGRRFSAYRSSYRARREAGATRVALPAGRPRLAAALAAIGFSVDA